MRTEDNQDRSAGNTHRSQVSSSSNALRASGSSGSGAGNTKSVKIVPHDPPGSDKASQDTKVQSKKKRDKRAHVRAGDAATALPSADKSCSVRAWE